MIYQTAYLLSSEQWVLKTFTEPAFSNWLMKFMKAEISYRLLITYKPRTITNQRLNPSIHLITYGICSVFFCLQSEELCEGMNRINEFLPLLNIPEYFQNSDMLLSFNECLKLMLYSLSFIYMGDWKKNLPENHIYLIFFATNSSFECFNTLFYSLILKSVWYLKMKAFF